VLKGLEHAKRPGMYIGDTMTEPACTNGFEVVDNAIDGPWQATATGSRSYPPMIGPVTVWPWHSVDIHPKRAARLPNDYDAASGGNFDDSSTKSRWPAWRWRSVNALSDVLQLTISRDGFVYRRISLGDPVAPSRPRPHAGARYYGAL